MLALLVVMLTALLLRGRLGRVEGARLVGAYPVYVGGAVLV